MASCRRIANFLYVVVSFCAPATFALDAASVAAWQADLDFLSSEFPKREGGFTTDERTAFDAEIASIRSQLDTLDEEHVIAGVMRAVACSRNGHTAAFPANNDARYARVPVRFWYFDDGVYVVKARPEYRRLLGARVTAIGGHSIDDAMARINTLAYGNDSWNQLIGAILISVPAELYGADVTTDSGHAEYDFVLRDGTRVREILAREPRPGGEENEAPWWDIAPTRRLADSNWVFALEETANELPLYIREPNKTLWYTYLKKRKTLYVQCNASYFEKGDDRHALAEGLFGEIEQQRPRKVVVDLRLNGGGDLTQMRGIFNQMAARVSTVKGARLFVITSKETFSAGVFHAANLKQQGATVVGELVGDDIDFWAEGKGPMELPNSKVRVSTASGFHSYSKVEQPEWKDEQYLDLSIDTLVPEIPVRFTFGEYVSGLDPVFDRILAESAK